MAVGALLVAPGLAHAGTFTIFTDASAFAPALSASSLKDFNDLPFTPGWSSECSSCTVNFSSGMFTDQAQTGRRTTLRFNNAITAWGGNFDLSSGGFGRGLRFGLRLDDGFSDVNVPGQIDGFAGQFYGFISDTPFLRVFVGPGQTGAGVETYSLADMRFGTASLQAAVQEPATWR